MGYVPAIRCHPTHKYLEHHEAQRLAFERSGSNNEFLAPGYPWPQMPPIVEFVRCPEIMDFEEETTSPVGLYRHCELFKSKGIHFTQPGLVWMRKRLLHFCSVSGIDLLLCLGWNSPGRLARQEYMAQRDFVLQLLGPDTRQHASCDLGNLC